MTSHYAVPKLEILDFIIIIKPNNAYLFLCFIIMNITKENII